MKAKSWVGPLSDMLDRYDDAKEAVKLAQVEERDRKWQLIQHAIDENMLDCLTVNVNRLRRYAD